MMMSKVVIRVPHKGFTRSKSLSMSTMHHATVQPSHVVLFFLMYQIFRYQIAVLL